MKAFVRDRYGSPDVLELSEVATPTVKAGEVLVRLRAASLNQADLDYLYGRPMLTRMGTGFRRPGTVAWDWTRPERSRRSARA